MPEWASTCLILNFEGVGIVAESVIDGGRERDEDGTVMAWSEHWSRSAQLLSLMCLSLTQIW
jgi:hypothetical protein